MPLVAVIEPVKLPEVAVIVPEMFADVAVIAPSFSVPPCSGVSQSY